MRRQTMEEIFDRCGGATAAKIGAEVDASVDELSA
jgi:hypothetical protein